METSQLVPRNKHDFERLGALVAAGPAAATPILGELLTWLQDINWPIANPLADYLVTIGEPLIPHLKAILLSHDDWWVYWVLQSIVARLSPSLVQQLEPELKSLVFMCENDHVALRTGAEAGVWDDTTLRRMLAKKIATYEECLSELKAIQGGLSKS